MKVNKKLGYNILGLLRAFNETQGNLALTLGISTSYLSEIVNGKKEPERSMIEKLARHFGMSPESLLYDDYSCINQITDFEEVVRLDKEYIEHWSLYLDVKILIKTLRVVFGSGE